MPPRRLHPLLRALLLLPLLALPARAADRFDLSTEPGGNLPKAGVRLRTIKNFQSTPLPLPQIYTYRNQRGDQLETYDPGELWRYDQTYGVWSHELGRMTVAVLDYPTDATLPLVGQKHVRMSDFREAMAEAPEWKMDEIRTWIETYTGDSIDTESGDGGRVRPRQPFRTYTFQGKSAEEKQAWCLLANKTRQRSTYLFVLFEFPRPDQVRDLAPSIERIVESVEWIGREERHDDSHVADGTAADDDASDTRAASYAQAKARVIRNIENLDDWWYHELDDYILVSNMEHESDRLIRMIEADLPILRHAYETLMPPIDEITEVSVIRVFATRDDYMAYIPAGYQWTGGIWMPGKKELVISPVEWNGSNRDNRRMTMGVVYHEAFHQYLFYAMGRREPPIWFNEGMAAFFEGAEVEHERKRIHVEENAMRVDRIPEALKRRSVGSLLRLSQEQFYEASSVTDNYVVAYALVYFLLKARDRDRSDAYDGLLRLVYQTLKTGGDAAAATAAVLDAYDVKKLHAAVEAFWDDRSARRAAERNTLFY